MITIECYTCRNIVGYAYSVELEGNKTVDMIADPFTVGVKNYIRCPKCYAKWQSKRPDLPHTHLVNNVR